MHIDGDTGWVIAEFGRHAGYVRNLEAHREVRVRIHRHWRVARARIVDDDDPQARLESVGRQPCFFGGIAPGRMGNRQEVAAFRAWRRYPQPTPPSSFASLTLVPHMAPLKAWNAVAGVTVWRA
jgi:deazaflavin-dependent oxidoreductase (nitroreductase family)